MLYAKQRRIDELEARTAMLRRKLDAARGTDQPAAPAGNAPDWEAVAKQLATDRTKAERAAQHEIMRLSDMNEVAAEIAGIDKRRIQRLARAAARHRKAITEQATTIAELTERLDRLEGGDRALKLAPPLGDDTEAQLADARRRLTEKDEHIRALDAQLAILETANRKTDWQSAKQTEAVSDDQPSMQQAS